MSLTDDDPFSDVHILEALQSAYITAETFDQHVAQSRCAKHNPEVERAAEKALNAIWECYQVIGGLEEDEGGIPPGQEVHQ